MSRRVVVVILHTINAHFNPLDKVVELYEQQIDLYKQILKEKTKLLEKFIQEKK
jgi:hypothetical protein